MWQTLELLYNNIYKKNNIYIKSKFVLASLIYLGFTDINRGSILYKQFQKYTYTLT